MFLTDFPLPYIVLCRASYSTQLELICRLHLKAKPHTSTNQGEKKMTFFQVTVAIDSERHLRNLEPPRSLPSLKRNGGFVRKLTALIKRVRFSSAVHGLFRADLYYKWQDRTNKMIYRLKDKTIKEKV